MAYAGNVQRLVKAVQELSTVRTLEEVMTFVRTAAREIGGADGATFVLKDGEFCFYADEDAIMPLWKGQRFPLNACVSGWAMLNKTQVAIGDIFDDPRVPVDAYRPTFVRSLAMTPIRTDAPIGAIGIYWSRKHLASPQQLELLQALADAVSVSMENVSLYGCLQQRIEELKRSNLAKEEFLMTLSHELRTPLNAILGWAELLAEEPLDSVESRQGLLTIQNSAKAQTRIIEDLLDMSYISSGKLKMDYKPVDVLRIVEQVIASKEADSARKSIEIRLETRLPKVEVLGDYERIHQILNNLIGNAIKFSESRTKILVRLLQFGPNLQIEVIDKGIGIAKDFLPNVFDRFRQGDSTLTRRYGGLGLGLAIAHHLVTAHKGEITVKSEGEGKGSTFTVKLPLLDPKVNEERPSSQAGKKMTESPASTPSEKELEAKKILVVDDDRDCRKLVETILKKTGASVRSASSVEEALRISEESPFDVVVCDISMPEIDGFEFLDRIRTGGTSMSPSLPIVALTAFADSNTQKTAIAKGFDNFLGKPFSSSHLVKTVSDLTAPK